MTGSLRAHILTPLQQGGTRFVRDGLLSWDVDGRLTPFGATAGPSLDLGRGDHLVVPGFVDAHVHLPQYRVRGRFQQALLPWLREHIWPEEARCADLAYLRAVALEFRDACLRSGTTTALIWGSPHAHSASVVLDELGPLRALGGDVLMDRNGPKELLRSVQHGLADAEAHAVRWGARYAVTPRFPPSNEERTLVGAGRIQARHGTLLQSHLAENHDEVLWVRALFPRASSYTGVFDDAGCLGPKTVLAHAIHLDDHDVGRIAATGTWIAHCPTSNVALGSGRMPLERWLDQGVRVALGSDVGAGPALSLLDVIACGRRIHRGHADLAPSRWLGLATLDGACALGVDADCGSLEPGKDCDAVILRLPGPLPRGATGDDAFALVLDAFDGRWDDAVAGVLRRGQPVAGFVSAASAS